MTTSLGQYWFNLLLLNICIVVSYLNAKKVNVKKASWWLMLLFCLFAFWDIDYFGLRADFENINQGESYRDFLYPFLSKISFGSYTVFRFYIWGLAELLFYKTIKLLGLNRNLTIYVMIMNFMLLFSFARASLGMAFYFYGLTYFAMSERNGKGIFVMLLCFLFSFFSHRSMAVLIVLTPLFFIKMNKARLFGILFLLFVVIVPLSRYVLLYQASVDVDGSGALGSLQSSAQFYSYLGVDIVEEENWKFALIKMLRNFSIIVGTIVVSLVLLKNKNRKLVSPFMNHLLALTIGVVLIAVSFLVQNTFGSDIIGYRILYMAGIPIVLLLSYSVQNGYCSWKLLHLAFLPSFLFQEGFIVGKILSLGVI